MGGRATVVRPASLLVWLIVLGLAVSACTLPWSAPIQGEGTLTVALGGPIITLDPAAVTDLNSERVCVQVYETLVEFNSQTGKFDPLLAQSWSSSSDGRVWTFTLRSGVTFHDGSALTAGAVIENFNRWMDTSSPYHRGEFDYWQMLFGGFKGSGSIVRTVRARG